MKIKLDIVKASDIGRILIVPGFSVYYCSFSIWLPEITIGRTVVIGFNDREVAFVEKVKPVKRMITFTDVILTDYGNVLPQVFYQEGKMVL